MTSAALPGNKDGDKCAGGCQDACKCGGEETRHVAGGMLVVIVTMMAMMMVAMVIVMVVMVIADLQ